VLTSRAGHEEECNYNCQCIGSDPNNKCGDNGQFCLPVNSTLGCCHFYRGQNNVSVCARSSLLPPPNHVVKNCLCATGFDLPCTKCDWDNVCVECDKEFVLDHKRGTCCKKGIPANGLTTPADRGGVSVLMWVLIAIGAALLLTIVGILIFAIVRRKRNHYEQIQ